MLPQIITDWLQILKTKKYAPNTISSYSLDIKIFVEFIKKKKHQEFNAKTLRSLKLADFREYLHYLDTKKDISPRTKARAVSTLKSLYKYGRNNSVFTNDAIHNLNLPKFSKKLPRALDEKTTKASIEEVDTIEYFKKNGESWVAFRDYILLKLIYSAGLRISEALNLKIKDTQNKFLRIEGKGGKERIVPLMEDVQKDLKELINICPYICPEIADDFIFLGKRGGKLSPAVFQRTIKTLRNQLNLEEDITPHSFRHSFATHLLNNSSDIRSVQELLGHASLSTTQIYTKVDKKRILSAFSEL